MLNVDAASENGPKELAEVKARLELTEQLRFEHTTRKQALQEALEKERRKLLNEIATSQKRETRTEN